MATYKVELLTPAQRELEEIARVYLELAGAESARKITDKILSSLERLKHYPFSGSQPRNCWLRDAGFRLIICEKYIAAYRLIDNTVYVYHIAHGATDYPKLFKELQ